MIDVRETGEGIRAVDAEKNELTIRAPDWDGGGQPNRIDRRVDEAVAGRASELRFPEAAVCIDSEGRERWRTFGSGIGPVRLADDRHLVQIEANITAYVSFTGSASIRRVSEGGDVVIEFPRSIPLTIGLRSRIRRPDGQISIPPTIKGLTAAVTHLGSALETTSPDRSYPSLRSHPPLVELDDGLDNSDLAFDTNAPTDIELSVPATLDSLFVAAPLAYYLQASLVPSETSTARLATPNDNDLYEFDRGQQFQHDVAEVLRRCFLLDCLVRNAGPFGTDLAEMALLDEVGLDSSAAYEATPHGRVERYLSIPFDAIDSELPDWHLSTHVDPTIDHIPTLPHLLDRLSLIYLPRADPLDRGELVERSLEESYRAGTDANRATSVSSVDPLLPDLQRGRVHGWMADGVPIDVFKSLPEAFENRLKYLGQGDGTKTVTVVLNEAEMDEEQTAATEIYNQRGDELSIDVTVERGLERNELAAVFERPRDFVHYIGHCDDSGLRCPDGNLSIADIEESNVQTFFLNACGSYQEGIELIRKGSVAGAVTLNRVLDNPATRVGRTFARLVMYGYSMERALRLSRRQSVISKNYMVVGDGTHRLSQGDDCYPANTKIEQHIYGKYNITTEVLPLSNNGGCYHSYFPHDRTLQLFGNEKSITLTKDKTLKYLDRIRDPITYDGEYYWSDELLSELS